MKKSAAVAVAILVAGAIPAIIQQRRINTARDQQHALSEAARHSPSLAGDSDPAETKLTKREREDQRKQTNASIAETLAFARSIEDLERSGNKPDAEFQRLGAEMVNSLMALSPSQLRQVIAALRDDSGLTPKTRGRLIAFAMNMFAKDQPQAALELYAGSSDLLEGSPIGSHAVSTALVAWAGTNPYAALDWIRDHQGKHADLSADEAMRHVIAGTAAHDPALAFQLISQLKLDDPEGVMSTILMSGSQNPEQRGAVLTALRNHLKTISDPALREELGAQAFETLARTSGEEGFDSLTRWMTDASFTAAEKQRFVQGLDYFSTRQDTGRWIDWMAENLPSANLAEPVREMVGEWTQQDYVSAGTWLAATPDGSAKIAAIEAYAEAVAEYEPQIAAQWAMTLPPGAARTATLQAVYQNWPAADPEGAAAFARDHGLE